MTLPVVLAAVALGGCGGGKGATGKTSSSPPGPPSREVAPGVVEASAGVVSATMHASAHYPRANRPWPVSFLVRDAGRPAKAEVSYEYLFAGEVVARRSHYRFDGSFHDTFIWPSSAVGYPLMFRAVIVAAGATLNLDYAVHAIE